MSGQDRHLMHVLCDGAPVNGLPEGAEGGQPSAAVRRSPHT